MLEALGNAGDVLREIYDCVYKSDQSGVRFSAYKLLAEIYEKLGQQERVLRALEQAIEIAPENTELRFNLAYKYAEYDETSLKAWYHYKVLIRQDSSNATAFNNLAVLCGNFALNAQSYSYYKTGMALNSDRALGNLANLLIDRGIIDQAEEVLTAADTSEKPDARIIDAWDRLQRKKKELVTESQKIDDSAQMVHEYTKRHIDLYENENIRGTTAEWVHGTWSDTDNCTFQFEGPRHSISGKMERGSTRYVVSGKLVDGSLHLSCTEDERDYSQGFLGLLSGLGPPTLLGGGWPTGVSASSPGKPNWQKITGDKKTISVLLQRIDTNEIDGLIFLDKCQIAKVTLAKT